MSSSDCCFLTWIQVSQEAGQVVWYSHLFQNFPQFIVIHIVKGFGVNILGFRELKWTGLGEFNSDDHYVYYCGQESLRRNGVAIMVNKSPKCVLGCNLKNDRMISVHFQSKPFNITVIQIYVPTINVEEAEVEQFYEDLQNLLELTNKKWCPFHHRGLECKSRKSRDTWCNRQRWSWSTKWS